MAMTGGRLTPAQIRRLKQIRSERSNRLREARRLAKMTQVEVAAAMGITQPMLSDFERQRWMRTSVDVARRFAEFYGCAIEDLFPARQAVA